MLAEVRGRSVLSEVSLTVFKSKSRGLVYENGRLSSFLSHSVDISSYLSSADLHCILLVIIVIKTQSNNQPFKLAHVGVGTTSHTPSNFPFLHPSRGLMRREAFRGLCLRPSLLVVSL